MKKAMLLSLVLVLFTVGALNAQYSLDSYLSSPPRNYKFTMGIIAAAGVSNLPKSGHVTVSYDPGLSACGGFFAKLAMNKYVAIQPELVANLNKYSYTYENYANVKETQTTSKISVQMPVSLLISPDHLTDGLGSYAGGGLFLGYLIEAKVKSSLPNSSYQTDITGYQDELFGGVQGMAGITYNIISLDLRASYEVSEPYIHAWNARVGLGIAFSN